jgi:hypothetical protein
MNETLDVKIGMAIGILGVSLIIIIGGLEISGLIISLSFFGWMGINLYHIKTKTWLEFLLFKVSLNLILNPFFILLLIKSWTMVKYRDQLEELDRKLHKNIII